jgi:hypothetical protein
MSIFYPDLEEQTPQMVELIISIYDLDLTRNWLPVEQRQSRYRKDPPPPDWARLIKSPRFKSNAVEILRIFRGLTSGFVRGVQNPLSSDALDRASQSESGTEPSLFSARSLSEHNRTGYFSGNFLSGRLTRSLRAGAKFTFTPFRISNAQSAPPCSLVTSNKVGVLNAQRCKRRGFRTRRKK